jgi:hypothetical protein
MITIQPVLSLPSPPDSGKNRIDTKAPFPIFYDSKGKFF